MEKIQELRFDSPKAVEQIKWEPAEVLPVQQINLASIERMPERKLEKVIPIKVWPSLRPGMSLNCRLLKDYQPITNVMKNLVIVLLLLSVAAFSSCEPPRSYSKALMVLKANGEVTVSKSDDRTVIHYIGPTSRETIGCLNKLSKSYSVTVNNKDQWKH